MDLIAKTLLSSHTHKVDTDTKYIVVIGASGLLSLTGSAGTAAGEPTQSTPDTPDQSMMNTAACDDRSDEMEACIESCFTVVQACERCAEQCAMQDEKKMAQCRRLCQDVADLATQCARLCSSELAGETSGWSIEAASLRQIVMTKRSRDDRTTRNSRSPSGTPRRDLRASSRSAP